MANVIFWNCLNSPFFPVRPIGAHQLASWIRQHGYTAKVIDFCHIMSTDDLVAITQKNMDSDTIAIGVSSTFWHDDASASWHPKEPTWVTDARLKLADANVKWLIGGAAASSPKLTLDWIKFNGFAEDSLMKWLDSQSAKLRFRKFFDITTATQTFDKDDFIQPSDVLPMELGRGCQFKCKFCSYPLVGKKKGTYIRGYDTIREEFIKNYAEYGTTNYYFLDDTVNESEEKVQALADMVQALPFELSWVGYNRLDLIWSKPETIRWLKDSGLRSAFFGIESFHPKASMVVGKGWNGKQGKEFLLRLKDEWKGDITWFLSLIVGLPGESKEDIEKTVEWCIANGMYDWGFYALSINQFPDKVWKSEFDLEYKKYGYSFPEGDLVNWRNELWTRQSAYAYQREQNAKAFPLTDLTVWALAGVTTLGYSFKEIMSQRKKDLPWQAIRRKTIEFVDRYVQYQLGNIA